MMRRRDLIAVLGGLLATPRALRVQRNAVPVFGFLSPFSRSDTEAWHQAFLKGLRDPAAIDGTRSTME